VRRLGGADPHQLVAAHDLDCLAPRIPQANATVAGGASNVAAWGHPEVAATRFGQWWPKLGRARRLWELATSTKRRGEASDNSGNRRLGGVVACSGRRWGIFRLAVGSRTPWNLFFSGVRRAANIQQKGNVHNQQKCVLNITVLETNLALDYRQPVEGNLNCYVTIRNTQIRKAKLR
jgi:hypothetical protein